MLELIFIAAGFGALLLTLWAVVTKTADGAETESSIPVVTRTATSDGAGTGTIAPTAGIQVVVAGAGGSANNIIKLPAPVVGSIIVLIVDATGLEVRTSDCTTIGINGGTDTAAESAIPASTTAVFVCETATNWKGFQMSSTAGTLAKVEVAAN